MQQKSNYHEADQAELDERATLRERITAILLMTPALGTMMLTYYGISVTMSETGATIVQKGQALAVSLSIGIFAWLGWFFLFGLIYRLSGGRLVGALLAAFFYVGTLAAIDAPFNMMAIAGGTAVQMSLVDSASSYEKKKERVFARATATRRLLPGMRTQAARFRVLEQDEIDHGTQSGRKGAGKVSSGFGQIATLLEALVTELEAGIAAAESVQADLATVSAQMKAETYRQGPIRARVEALTVAGDRIDDLLARLGQYEYSASISATLDTLENIFPAPNVANSNFERVQNGELAVIAEMAKPVAEALHGGLKELQEIGSVEVKRLRPLGPHEAVRHYWWPLFPEWCAALFIDLAPIGLLVILIAAWRERDRRACGRG